MSAPFHRSHVLAAQIAQIVTMFANDFAARQAALGSLPEYCSRGKGKGRWQKARHGAAKAAQRAAVKARNVRRHRLACR